MITLDEIEIILLRSIVERRETCRQAAVLVYNSMLEKDQTATADDPWVNPNDP